MSWAAQAKAAAGSAWACRVMTPPTAFRCWPAQACLRACPSIGMRVHLVKNPINFANVRPDPLAPVGRRR